MPTPNKPNPPKTPQIVGLIRPKTPQTIAPVANTPKPTLAPKPVSVIAPEQTDIKNPNEKPIFQAIGVIAGEIDFEKRAITVTERGVTKAYQLFYTSKCKRIFEFMQHHARRVRSNYFRLLVYPKVVHFPGRETPHKVTFQVVGYERCDRSGAFTEFVDFEFRLCGLWQFIPVCQTPCVTILRNFSKERKDLFFPKAPKDGDTSGEVTETPRAIDPVRKLRFLKAGYLPLMWRDGAKPFRFNPRLGKDEDQGKPLFVQVKARFSVSRDLFFYIGQYAEPLEESPWFLKVKNADKQAALIELKKAKAAKVPVKRKN